jgi:hypothetical protein
LEVSFQRARLNTVSKTSFKNQDSFKSVFSESDSSHVENAENLGRLTSHESTYTGPNIFPQDSYGFGRRHDLWTRIAISIIFVLAGRMLYLGEAFRFMETNPSTTTGWPRKQGESWQVWTQILPSLFKSWAILFTCQYKLHIFYVHKREECKKKWVFFYRLCFFLFLIYSLIDPVTYATNVPGFEAMMICYISSICFLVPLSIISLVTAYWALQALDFGALRNERPMIYMMEVCCQIIILTRLATTFTQKLFIYKTSMFWASYLMCYFLFSELIPFLIIVLGI